MERYPKMITSILINGIVMLEEDGETSRLAIALRIEPERRWLRRPSPRTTPVGSPTGDPSNPDCLAPTTWPRRPGPGYPACGCQVVQYPFG